MLEDEDFEFLGTVAKVFENREAAVDVGIQQRIHQEAGVVVAQARAFGFEALANGIPHVAGGLLEGQDGFVTQENRNLLALQAFILQLQGVGDDEQAGLHFTFLAAIRLDLGPLR